MKKVEALHAWRSSFLLFLTLTLTIFIASEKFDLMSPWTLKIVPNLKFLPERLYKRLPVRSTYPNTKVMKRLVAEEIV